MSIKNNINEKIYHEPYVRMKRSTTNQHEPARTKKDVREIHILALDERRGLRGFLFVILS